MSDKFTGDDIAAAFGEGLHPYQREILARLVKCTEGGRLYVMTTHGPKLIGEAPVIAIDHGKPGGDHTAVASLRGGRFEAMVIVDEIWSDPSRVPTAALVTPSPDAARPARGQAFDWRAIQRDTRPGGRRDVPRRRRGRET